jgi:hypothetical protein
MHNDGFFPLVNILFQSDDPAITGRVLRSFSAGWTSREKKNVQCIMYNV